jgi:hypothetical protein
MSQQTTEGGLVDSQQLEMDIRAEREAVEKRGYSNEPK